MSVTYTADVWCDCGGCAHCGTGCSIWTHGATASTPPAKGVARENAQGDGFHHWLGKDYCRACFRELVGAKPG